MPHFLATSRIVVRPKPIFWKSWSETSRIFFLVASFLVSRRPMSVLFRCPQCQHQEDGDVAGPAEFLHGLGEHGLAPFWGCPSSAMKATTHTATNTTGQTLSVMKSPRDPRNIGRTPR